MTYWEFFRSTMPLFLNGAVVTLKISAVALVIGFVVGTPLAFIQLYGSRLPRLLATAYVEFMRGTPLMVQLFVIYYGLPQFGIVFSSTFSAFLALGLNSAAYQAEYFRGAILAVGERQMIAARSIGMSKLQAIRCIMLPQAVRIALPSWPNEAIYMIKNTAIVYMIAVPELMAQASKLTTKYYNPVESYSTVAIYYLVIVGVLSLLFALIEKKARIPTLQAETSKKK